MCLGSKEPTLWGSGSFLQHAAGLLQESLQQLALSRPRLACWSAFRQPSGRARQALCHELADCTLGCCSTHTFCASELAILEGRLWCCCTFVSDSDQDESVMTCLARQYMLACQSGSATKLLVYTREHQGQLKRPATVFGGIASPSLLLS